MRPTRRGRCCSSGSRSGPGRRARSPGLLPAQPSLNPVGVVGAQDDDVGRCPSLLVTSLTASRTVPSSKASIRSSTRVMPSWAGTITTWCSGRASHGSRLLRNSSAATTIRPGGRDPATVAAASASDPSVDTVAGSTPMSRANNPRAWPVAASQACRSNSPDDHAEMASCTAWTTGSAPGGAPGVSSHTVERSAGNSSRNCAGFICSRP